MEKVENINPYDGNAPKDGQVERMFDSIAPAYDFMNRAMTFGLHRRWLHHLVAAASATESQRVLDIATGTGDVAIALAQAMSGASITGMDLSEGMLARARAKAADKGLKIGFVRGDALATGLPSGTYDLITVAYGVRNYADLRRGMEEACRLLCAGGHLLVLELCEPSNPLMRAGYRLYSRTLIPFVGRLVSHDTSAYSYLPRSIAACPQRYAMTSLMEMAGFEKAVYRSLFPGVCALYSARKPLDKQ
ncbi:MAG: bifunctional demethylmenaquinone methyltransferase/2-methoxy-6-polyprenyl-1,4-benzoquinol methylase UbiE [Muribaculaceae bacterium]|nr:bifunctional demethylmenaquinone methyltransferase/2-methoxy-6-polyprenyl-1,4-benzoquinol methylase UbiE [Muribaculaceae bacterium]